MKHRFHKQQNILFGSASVSATMFVLRTVGISLEHVIIFILNLIQYYSSMQTFTSQPLSWVAHHMLDVVHGANQPMY